MPQFLGHRLRSAVFLGLFFESDPGHFYIFGRFLKTSSVLFRLIW